MIATNNWNSLSIIYLVESKLDYRTILYDSTTTLKELNTTYKMFFVPIESMIFSVSETFLHRSLRYRSEKDVEASNLQSILPLGHITLYSRSTLISQSKTRTRSLYYKISNYLNELNVEA